MESMGLIFFHWFKKQVMFESTILYVYTDWLQKINTNITFFQCMKSASIHKILYQMSYGFSTRVSSYGCYDVNGYKFRSEKYESEEHRPEQEANLNGQVLYDVSCGPRSHGRLAIGHGAIRAADVRAAGRNRNMTRQPSNTVSVQGKARENTNLSHENTRLCHENSEKDRAVEVMKVTAELCMVCIFKSLSTLLQVIYC